jgi:hypothetical protein
MTTKSAVLSLAVWMVLTSCVNAWAQEVDDLPRLGETAAEYRARLSKTPAERATNEAAARAAGARDIAAKELLDDITKERKARRQRAQREHEMRCNRLSQRAGLDWSQRAVTQYEAYCAD